MRRICLNRRRRFVCIPRSLLSQPICLPLSWSTPLPSQVSRLLPASVLAVSGKNINRRTKECIRHFSCISRRYLGVLPVPRKALPDDLHAPQSRGGFLQDDWTPTILICLANALLEGFLSSSFASCFLNLVAQLVACGTRGERWRSIRC